MPILELLLYMNGKSLLISNYCYSYSERQQPVERRLAYHRQNAVERLEYAEQPLTVFVVYYEVL